jgi:hypothetical protein
MKVYAIDKEFNLTMWHSVKIFEQDNSWTDPQYLKVVAASELVDYSSFIHPNAHGLFLNGRIVYRYDQAMAHNMLVTINRLKTSMKKARAI